MTQEHYLVPKGTRLYHGTMHPFNPGDIVKPMNYNTAFATSDPDYATKSGRYVFEVEPIDRDEAEASTREGLSWWKFSPSANVLNTVRSKTGFRVVKLHPALSNAQFQHPYITETPPVRLAD